MSQPDFKPQFERLPAGMQAIASALQNLPANYCIDKPDCELAKTLAAIEAYVKVHK